ncbi:Trk system potassium transporter TrkA [Aquibaculum arenosum]|uniref:Trk system potassium uptake protein TrkA n=1 Tax=Aquibaculum arenosum TaxID=3032591 RepID=A0ABT5YMK0_9PROT|nr:Trk system potassium transporter TrkA [Fodinicurvata sp. CAU 1616]MDF2096181.1 Trk system potassium transporter TrkA [Fodinicurvata sp. CAU 1616]
MKFIICGAGQVGFNIARYLAGESADVTVVDQSPELIQKITDLLDVNGVVGFASHPDVLERAGAQDADMLIAVTYADEVNMVACQVGHSLFEVPTKIARIRNQSYLNPLWSDLFSASNLPIDVIISPEVEVSRAIERRLMIPGAFDAINLAGGKVTLVGVHVREETPIISTPLRQLTDLFPDLHIYLVTIRRGDNVIAPGGDDELQPGDDVYFMCETAHLERAMLSFGYAEKEARRLVLIGGGNIGLELARSIEERHSYVQLKVIEYDKVRAERVAQTLRRSVVIHGDALEQDILAEANVGTAETVITVTNDDEVNILAALLAKKQGCARAITLINSTSYAQLLPGLGVDTVVSPRAITVSTILQHVRRGRIRAAHSLADGVGEVIEAEVLETSGLAGSRIREAGLPDGVVIGALVRNGAFVVPRGGTVIQAGDLVVLFAKPGAVKKVERLFSVKLEFF